MIIASIAVALAVLACVVIERSIWPDRTFGGQDRGLPVPTVSPKSRTG